MQVLLSIFYHILLCVWGGGGGGGCRWGGGGGGGAAGGGGGGGGGGGARYPLPRKNKGECDLRKRKRDMNSISANITHDPCHYVNACEVSV